MEEPSVLDYVKSLLTPWKGRPIQIPPVESVEETPPQAVITEEMQPEALLTAEVQSEPAKMAEAPTLAVSELPLEVKPSLAPKPRQVTLTLTISLSWPWRAMLALILAFGAQRAFAPPTRSPKTGTLLLLLSLGFTLWAILRQEWQPAPMPDRESKDKPFTIRGAQLGLGCLLAILAFLTSGGNRFSVLNLSLLALSLVFLFWAFWQRESTYLPWLKKLLSGVERPNWNISLSRWTLLVLAVIALVLFFRLYRLDQVPPEMVSDHAEKYLDVLDILRGQTSIFFPRNGGREALQFYLVTALYRYFHLGLNFLTLKISTVLIGLLTLPYIYLLGKEVGNRRVGLLAFAFAGIAYWTNVVSRAGMRLPFYFLFTAAALYYLLRGLRTTNRNDFILTGLFLGLGFYGYSADRILPFMVVTAIVLYLLHSQSKGQRRSTVLYTLVAALIAIVVFLPLLRYMTQDPEGFLSRMFSRMGTVEQTLPGPPMQIFLNNLWRSITMFSWSDGVVWVVSVPDYPALDIIAGGLFYIGIAMVLYRYLRRRHWLDLFLILSIPLLMLPSILALAFPSENPSLYRTGGAMVPVFLLVAIALDALMSGLEAGLGKSWGPKVAWAAFALLLGFSALLNYDLVFNKYFLNYQLSSWNTSEMGQVIRDFADTTGSPDTAWLMGFPHWADTRLVGINAGYPGKDFALFVEQLPATQADPRPKLFLVNPLDSVAIEALLKMYPQGWYMPFKSKAPTKDFLMFFVPPNPS
jgi:hypothetical protein